MSDLRDAARQALEALMWHDETVRTRGDDEAIEALRAALEQPNRAQKMRDAGYTRRPTLREMAEPEHPEQEPDNKMKHCCYCGKPLVEVPIEPEDNHD